MGVTIQQGIAAGGSGGKVLQVLQTQYATYSAISTPHIPFDDTVPTSSEGTQILSQAITPASASNKVLVHVSLPQISTSNAAYPPIITVFRGTTCIGATLQNVIALEIVSVDFCVLDEPATASAVTYSVRVGNGYSSAGVYAYVNGNGGRKFGGASKATLTVSEIAA